MAFVWPYTVLRPSRVRPPIMSTARQGGASISGYPQVAATTGGFWRVTMDFQLTCETHQKMAAVMAEIHYQKRVILPIYALLEQPWAEDALPRMALQPDIWNAELAYQTRQIDATMAAAGAMRDAYIDIIVPPSRHSAAPYLVAADGAPIAFADSDLLAPASRGSALIGGEWLSINHGEYGWGLYRVGRIVSVSGNQHRVNILPTLRHAVASGTAVEMDVPRLTCMMESTSESFPDVTPGRMADFSVTFVEALA